VLINTLKNLFSTRHPVRQDGRLLSEDDARSPNAPAAPPAGRHSLSQPDIDASFYGLTLGVQSALDSRLNRFEESVVREFDHVLTSDISHNRLVPRIPKVVPRLMHSLRDPAVSIQDLSRIIGEDAVVISEVLRLANSPFYRTNQPVDSLETAVVLLGQQGVRQLIASVMLKPLINVSSGHFTTIGCKILWEQTQKAALACDCIARDLGEDRSSAFLAGIVQNVGFTVALTVLDRYFDGSDAPRSAGFRDTLVRKARTLSALIAKQWDFPLSVYAAIHAQRDNSRMQQCDVLASILYTGSLFQYEMSLKGGSCF
jgi:HD-like signal output (HDOD) protein